MSRWHAAADGLQAPLESVDWSRLHAVAEGMQAPMECRRDGMYHVGARECRQESIPCRHRIGDRMNLEPRLRYEAPNRRRRTVSSEFEAPGGASELPVPRRIRTEGGKCPLT